MALKDKLMTLEDFKAVRDVDVASNSAQFTEIKADLPNKVALDVASQTTIPANSDFNNYTTPGNYKVTTLANSKTMGHIPVEAAGTLIVGYLISSTQVFQEYRVPTSSNGLRVFKRVYRSNAWTDWLENTTSLQFAKALKISQDIYTAIASNTDLNDVITAGTYKVTSSAVASTLSNTPLTGTGFVLNVIEATSNATILQIISGANENTRTFVRFINITNETYGDWNEVSFEGLADAVTALGVTVSSNTSRIVTLEETAGIDREYLTPYTAQEQDLYDKVNNDIDKNTLVFLVSTDNHYRETADSGSHQVEFAQVMAKIAKRLRVDAIINLGDIITQYMDSVDDAVYENEDVTAEEINTRRLAKMAAAFQSTSVPFLYTLAHHEMSLHTNGPTSTDNTTQTSVYPYPESKVLGLCGKGAEWIEEHHYTQDPLSAGYYVDFSRHKIRLIFIDSVSYSATGFTPSSIAFITEAFSNVPTGYKVIVCTHVATREPGVYSATIKNWEQVEAIMQNYVSGGGTILAVLHGHAHYDNVVFIENVPYPYICICCAENSWSTVGEKIEAGVQGNPVSYKYHAARYGALGTYNEYLFDIMCVHPDTNTLKFFRFGIGEDRTVTLATS